MIVVGFWPSFFRRPLGLGIAHRIHGITATLWILTLATQSWLMARGRVVAHRRVARAAFVLMPVMCVSALYMVRTMQTNLRMPPGLPALLGFVDLFSIAFLATLFGLALGHVHRPGAHKRFMAATVLLGFPPALTRLFLWTAGVGFMPALHASFVVTEVVLVALLVSDRRNAERHLAYRLSLAFFVLLQALMVPVSGTGAWQALMAALG